MYIKIIPTYILILFVFSFIVVNVSAKEKARDYDPNDYFKDRSWSVDAGKQGTLNINTEYRAEPVKSPNKLKITLKCSKSKKEITILENFKYCGVNAVSVVGNKVELLLTDFDFKDSKGYCNIPRKKYLPLPKCKK